MIFWLASQDVFDLTNEIKLKNHHPRLAEAKVAVAFDESKPFIRGRYNWGRAIKVNPLIKIFQKEKYDFIIIVSSLMWYDFLIPSQKEAMLDLHLCRFTPEYMPLSIIENGKKKIIKDKYGRIDLSSDYKFDSDGNVTWKVDPLDLPVFTRNIKNYGLWTDSFRNFKEALKTINE